MNARAANENYLIIFNNVHFRAAHPRHIAGIYSAFCNLPCCQWVFFFLFFSFFFPFFHSTVFLSYPGIEPGHRIPVIRAATIVFSKAMRFFETQYLDLLARSDYPRKLLLLLRDNFWWRFALCRYSDPSKFPPEFLYVYIHICIYMYTSVKLSELTIFYTCVIKCHIDISRACPCVHARGQRDRF